MELYFRPLACSLATRIALYEAGTDAVFVQFDRASGKTSRGEDFASINPLRQVPVLRTEEGELLTENIAVLPYVADHFPEARLAPVAGPARYRMHSWLGFITSELHKALFVPLLGATVPAEVKAYAAAQAEPRLAKVEAHLEGRDFMLDDFSIVDAYLFTVLNWARISGVIDLSVWPNLIAFHDRCKARPAVARALAEEFALYQEEQARKKVA